MTSPLTAVRDPRLCSPQRLLPPRPSRPHKGQRSEPRPCSSTRAGPWSLRLLLGRGRRGPRDSSLLLGGSGGPLGSPATAPVSAVASWEGTLRTPEGRGGRVGSAGSPRGLGGEGAEHRWGERKRSCPDAPLLASSGSPRSRRRRGPQASAWAPAAPSPQSPHTADISLSRVLRKRAQVFCSGLVCVFLEEHMAEDNSTSAKFLKRTSPSVPFSSRWPTTGGARTSPPDHTSVWLSRPLSKAHIP